MYIVTGMHRSGTSLVARMLYEAGADFGDPATLYPGDRWNPDGYFEKVDIHQVNMPLVHGALWKLAYFKLPSERRILHRAERMSSRIAEVGARYQGKYVKDCRFCLTLPAWQRYGPAINKILLCVREPLNVAESLRRRNKLPLRLGYSLWRRHNERLMEAAKGTPFWVVHYRRLIDPELFAAEAGAMLSFMELPADPATLERLRDGVIKPQFNHGSAQPAGYPCAVGSVWSSLVDLHDRQLAPQRASS